MSLRAAPRDQYIDIILTVTRSFRLEARDQIIQRTPHAILLRAAPRLRIRTLLAEDRRETDGYAVMLAQSREKGHQVPVERVARPDLSRSVVGQSRLLGRRRRLPPQLDAAGSLQRALGLDDQQVVIVGYKLRRLPCFLERQLLHFDTFLFPILH